MIRCNKCREILDQDELVVVSDDPSPKGIALPPGSYNFYFCPHCGSDDFEEGFELIEEIEMVEEDETSVIISFEGKSFMLYLDEYGELDCIPHESKKPEEVKAKEVA